MNRVSTRPSVSRHASRCLCVASAAFIMLSIAGCAQQGSLANRTPDDKIVETADFYWQYAALAAEVYQTKGRVSSQLALVMTSNWLREEVAAAADPRVRNEYARLLKPDTRRFESERTGSPCSGNTPRLLYISGEDGAGVGEIGCKTAKVDDDDDEKPSANDQLQALIPEDPEDCTYQGRKKPFVPVHLALKQYGWEQVPELRRQLHPRGWSLFVPGLAIDVWRRKLADEGESPVVEYALVYRGTVGSGGWFSNLRAITAFTPLVWDQYRQARVATSALVEQIGNLHRLSDTLFKRKGATQVRITSVGHSLGGGLANYVFLRVPEITRVVGFDPSPVDGSSTFSPHPLAVSFDPSRADGSSEFSLIDEKTKRSSRDRESVLTGPRQPIDHHPRDPNAAIFMLYEEGEILTRLGGCHSGPIWGAEGGPVVRCESLDLSGGSILHQHNMPQLACKLYLAKSGKPTRRKN